MSMLSESRSRSRTRPLPLPSPSLEGLERFVPPERSPLRNYIPQWKLDKPLPHLPSPRRTSSLYNFDDRYHWGDARARRYGRSLSGKGPCSKLGTVLNTCSMEDLSIGRPQENRLRDSGVGGALQPASPLLPASPLRKHWRGSSDVEAAPIKRLRRSPVPGSLLHGAQSLRSPNLRENFEAGNGYSQRQRTVKSERPQSRKTNHSVDPTLVPLPLGVDEGLQVRNEIQPLPSPARFENRNVCLCHNPHPCHSETIPSTPWSEAPKPEFIRPRTASSTATAKPPKKSAAQTERAETVSHSSRVPKRSVDSDSANRTQLYSFSANTSICETPSNDNSNRNSQVNIGDVNNGIHDHLGTSDLPQPPPTSYSHLQRAPSPFTEPQTPAPSPPRRRTKQLAIPPTEYQQLGPKIWSKTTTKPKRKTSQILPRLVAKLIPKVLRSRSSKSQLQQKPAPSLQKAASAQDLMSSRPLNAKGAPPDEWGCFGGNNKNAWRSTMTLGRRISRETFGISRSEKKRREEIKSHIVMVGPTTIQVVDDEVRWV